MRIVQVITRSDSVGGAHVHLRDLCLHLINGGHQVVVLVGGRGPFLDELSLHGIPYETLSYLIRPIQPWVDIRALFELREKLRELQPDLVATHSSKAGWIGRIAARSLGLPVVFTAHGWAFTEGVPLTRRLLYICAERLAAQFASRIITVSDFDRSLALEFRVAPEARMVTIHNGMSEVNEILRAKPEQTPPRIVMVARFEHPKDHGLLIRALSRNKDIPWTLELVGDGPLRPEVEQLTASLGLMHRVEFVGTRNDVPERLAKAQILALVSRWEGFPLTILEGMRAGLPIVASDVGGVREAVSDGRTGFLTPRGDVDTLATKLRILLGNAELRKRMGVLGRNKFQEHFTFDHMFRKTLDVYATVAADKQHLYKTSVGEVIRRD